MGIFGRGGSDKDSPDLSLYQRASKKRTERGAISTQDGASCPGPLLFGMNLLE